MTDYAVSKNPANGEILARYPMQSLAELDSTLAASTAAFKQWRNTDIASRVKVLRQLAEQLRKRCARHENALCHFLHGPRPFRRLAQLGNQRTDPWVQCQRQQAFILQGIR